MALLEDIERTIFLGEEFLTWLWFRSQTEGAFDLPGGDPVRIEMSDPLVFRGAEDQDAQQVTLKGERSAQSPEAFAALRAGKRLVKCRIVLRRHDEVWPCALKSDALGASGLGLPVPKGVPMPDGLIMRGEKVEEFSQMYFALYEMFLDLRLHEGKWKKVTKAIHDWAMEAQGE